jgi:hypothetical protein
MDQSRKLVLVLRSLEAQRHTGTCQLPRKADYVGGRL